MAYIYNDVVGDNLKATLYSGFSKWTNWNHVEENQFFTLSSTEYVWDIYYVDNIQSSASGETYVGKVGIAVPAHDAHTSTEHPELHYANTCYTITRDVDTGEITFNDHIVISTGQSLLMIATNTVFYVGVRDNPTADPHGVFASVVMNQVNKELSEVAVGFYNNTTCTLYDSNQVSGTSVSISPQISNFRYSILVPIYGLNFGVMSGIYFFVCSQAPASYVPFSTMTMNGKTFYVDDNIALIDYFTGL